MKSIMQKPLLSAVVALSFAIAAISISSYEVATVEAGSIEGAAMIVWNGYKNELTQSPDNRGFLLSGEPV